MTKRTYDIVLFGATGFTGKLVAAYLFKTYGINNGLKWAMAGRSKDKLEKVQKELGISNVPTIVADSKDKDSLVNLATQAKVVCTTVGPYAVYGSDLVAACVAQGTHYCDLTGEPQWIYKMISEHHQTAKANKVKIVNSCGFDSIPSDMGVYFLQKKAYEKFGTYCNQVKFRLKGAKGGISGGTYASLGYILKEVESNPEVMDILNNPLSLTPYPEREAATFPKAAYDEDFKRWYMPFLMEMITTKTVYRSNALLGDKYGSDFQYHEAMLSGGGIQAKVFSSVMQKVVWAKPNSLLRKTIDTILPKPGEGPSEKARKNGFFKIAFLGKNNDGQSIKTQVIGDKDPGYGSTSKMLGESAVCLAMDDLNGEYGVVTPSSAMGDKLLERLQQNAGLSFDVK